MTEAYIVDASRTAVGRRKGGFAAAHPADMAAHVIKTVVERHDIDPAAIDDVILGCLDNIGSQAGDIARTAALAAGLPETVPGVTIDRQCGSAQQAVHFAAQAVMSGTSDLIVAGGVQKMSQYPILSAFAAGEPFGSIDPWTGCEGWAARYGDQEISQFRGAEMIAQQWNLSREDTEKFAFESHQRALTAIAEGRFTREITEYAGVSVDEVPRADTSLEKMASLPTLVDGGVLTAAVASQISDGAAALLVASKSAVDRFGLTPRARIHHISVRGADPVMMLTVPIPATQHALKRAG
ncbi:MAG: acetyl-CoA C-acyltransferase, partial [Actinobacteria bacterium]|nr:acetyl-CoA C-acyltransferase [Actinomycetota bacterium]